MNRLGVSYCRSCRAIACNNDSFLPWDYSIFFYVRSETLWICFTHFLHHHTIKWYEWCETSQDIRKTQRNSKINTGLLHNLTYLNMIIKYQYFYGFAFYSIHFNILVPRFNVNKIEYKYCTCNLMRLNEMNSTDGPISNTNWFEKTLKDILVFRVGTSILWYCILLKKTVAVLKDM